MFEYLSNGILLCSMYLQLLKKKVNRSSEQSIDNIVNNFFIHEQSQKVHDIVILFMELLCDVIFGSILSTV